MSIQEEASRCAKSRFASPCGAGPFGSSTCGLRPAASCPSDHLAEVRAAALAGDRATLDALGLSADPAEVGPPTGRDPGARGGQPDDRRPWVSAHGRRLGRPSTMEITGRRHAQRLSP